MEITDMVQKGKSPTLLSGSLGDDVCRAAEPEDTGGDWGPPTQKLIQPARTSQQRHVGFHRSMPFQKASASPLLTPRLLRDSGGRPGGSNRIFRRSLCSCFLKKDAAT